jgi:predicted dithiol-disulfide oxidoreductase (DUF899 family)
VHAHARNAYDRDYFGDSRALTPAMRRQQAFEDGKEWDMPMMNVFRKEGDGSIRHTWGSELLYVPPEPGQQYRHNDAVDPVWGLLDMTPEGRTGLAHSRRTSNTSTATSK